MELGLSFGTFAPKIKEQIKDQELIFTGKYLETYQKAADAVTTLLIRRLITEGVAKKARIQILEMVSKETKVA